MGGVINICYSLTLLTSNGVIINGDCRRVLRDVPDDSVDFILTDPPFNVGIAYDNYDDNLDEYDYYIWCYEWCRGLYRVLKKSRYAVIFTSDIYSCHVVRAAKRSGFIFWHFIKWNKPNSNRKYCGTIMFSKTELALVCSKGKPDVSTIDKSSMYCDTLVYNNLNPVTGGVDHNAQRPVPLYEQIIKGFTRPGELVLDAFLGSGTTAIACEKLGRRYIGIDISRKYCNMASDRVSAWTKQIRIDEYA